MVEIELLISWIGSFLIFVVLFKVFNKKAKKDKPLSLWLKTIMIGLCFHINVIFSLILYEPVMKVFDISTDGFMNLNGVFTLAIIWLVIAAITFAIAKALRQQLGTYYKTIRITYIVLFCLPLLILFLFLFVTSLK